jgi:hypothetical protein
VCKVAAARAHNRSKSTDQFRQYITMDETWLLQYTPESNRPSAEWTERDELNPKREKMQRSAGVSIMGCTWYYTEKKSAIRYCSCVTDQLLVGKTANYCSCTDQLLLMH